MEEEALTVEREDSAEPRKAQVLAEIFDDLRRVFQAVQEHSKRVERETGLTGPQAWTIRIIADHEPIRISDIARRMYLHVATVVGIVDRLEARGFVQRIRDQKDRRVVHVELTAEGRSLVSKAPQVAQGMLLSGLEMLPERKLKTVHTGMKTMVSLLNAQKLTPKLLMSDEVNIQNGSVTEDQAEG